jgi:hypothetical protein
MGLQASVGCATRLPSIDLSWYSFAAVLIRCLNPFPHQLVDDSPVLSAVILQRCRMRGIGSELKQQRIGGRGFGSTKFCF